MKICLTGPMPSQNSTTGVQQFNEHTVNELREMGHQVTIALPQGGVFALPMAARAQQATSCDVITLPGVRPGQPPDFLRPVGEQLAYALSRFGHVFVSGSNLDYARILRAVECPAAVTTHGNHISPLRGWDGAELKRPGRKYLCVNSLHMREARVKGLEEQAVMFDLPVLQPQAEVQSAGSFAVAVGNLESRKNYPAVAMIAEALGRDTRVYGRTVHEKARDAVERSKRLKYMGFVPHDKLDGETAKAEFVIHTALVEGFPTALRDRNAQGIPAIVPDIPLYREGLDNERNIFLDPKRPFGEQLAELDLAKYRKIAFRRELAAETHKRFGKEAFRAQLTQILEG